MKLFNHKFFFKVNFNFNYYHYYRFFIVDSKISNKFSIYYDSLGKFIKFIYKGKVTVLYLSHNIKFQHWTDLFYDGKSISYYYYN